MKTALVILAEGFEEIEAIAVIDILRRAGVNCTIAAQHDGKFVTGKTGIQVVADELFHALRDKSFDLLVLPGGPGSRHLRKDTSVLEMIRKQVGEGRLTAAICAATTVLYDAGILEGREYTGHFSVKAELPQIIDNQKVVWDGNVATSQGAGTALEFALSLVERLYDAKKAEKISKAICLT
ncbi:MAG TPA: DJ-1 family glyoxalase III [Opitutales bacterium]|nr:DJ-1 family glyoxalase III [Opitutales bacterium]